MKRKDLHGLAGRLMVEFRTDGISEAQHATLDAAISELEYRNRRAVQADRCTCWLCLGPFELDDPSSTLY